MADTAGQWHALTDCVVADTAGGMGINLQTADTVILMDSDWNPQVEGRRVSVKSVSPSDLFD